MALEPRPQQATPLFRAIPTRQSSRGPSHGRPAAPAGLDALAAAGADPACRMEAGRA